MARRYTRTNGRSKENRGYKHSQRSAAAPRKMRKKGGSNAQPTKNSEGKQMTTTISKELGHPDLN